MMFSRISNLVLVLELSLERNSPRLRKCRRATLYILLKVLGQIPRRKKGPCNQHMHTVNVNELPSPLQKRGKERGEREGENRRTPLHAVYDRLLRPADAVR